MPNISSSTTSLSHSLEAALAGIPPFFRTKLIAKYIDVRSAYAAGNHDNVGQRMGFFSEVLLRFLQEQLMGAHTPFGKQLPTFVDECKRLENATAQPGDEGLRILMPRGLAFVYSLRNKRGIGHVGGDVDANEIDSATCVRIADWCVCELIRYFHHLSLEEAQALLDAIVIRQLPEVWSVGGKRRVLDSTLGYKDQVLLLLYGEPEVALTAEDLCGWTDHPRLADFRSRALRPLHRQRLIEFDEESQTALLSPTGAEDVESRILPGIRQRLGRGIGS